MTAELTQIILSLEGGAFSIVTLIIGSWVNNRFKDKQAATTLTTAIDNALGAAQQAAEALTRGEHPDSKPMAVAVQYVLDHAGDEAKRFGISPLAIADKIMARTGVASIAHTGTALVATALQIKP